MLAQGLCISHRIPGNGIFHAGKQTIRGSYGYQIYMNKPLPEGTLPFIFDSEWPCIRFRVCLNIEDASLTCNSITVCLGIPGNTPLSRKHLEAFVFLISTEATNMGSQV